MPDASGGLGPSRGGQGLADAAASREQARTWLHEARQVVCLTGAGCSAESGIPTFRDAQTGYWSRFNPEELASVAGFQRHPDRVWQWYRARRRQVQQCVPHAGHRALVALANQVPQFDLVTQNVDDLHERAGHPSVLHLHGELSRFRCLACRRQHVLKHTEMDGDAPPHCATCGGMIRPDVIWFGELLDPVIWAQACQVCKTCDLMLVVGTSGLVRPAADLPVIARENRARIVEINPDVTAISAVAQVVLRVSASQGLCQLLA